MRRREFIAAITVAASWPFPAFAQQPRTIPRVCFLTFDPEASRSTRFGAFFRGLRDLGYADGQTITIDYLSADGRGERFPALAAECLRLKADIIVASTTPATQAAKLATHTIPIVMLHLGDPVGAGLVDSLVRPGGNVTGNTIMVSELAAKRLTLLKEAVPKISRVQDIQTADDLPAAFEAGAKENAEGLIVGAESIFYVNRARVSELAARYRLPAMYPLSTQVTDAGGLMAYDIDIADLQRRAAIYVDRILQGAKPADLPVEQPTHFNFVINLKTAKALGLTIPESVLQRADEVVE